MKNWLMTMALCVALAHAGAQTVDNRAVGYCVRYEKQHLFLQKDSGLNVVDYDIEWPEVVGYSHVPRLQRYISESIAGEPTLGFDSLATSLRQRYGTPVSRMFSEIPDDRRFCYVTASARVVGYEPNHWIAYHVSLKVEPGKRSAFKAEAFDRVVVCDLTDGKLYQASNLASSSIMNRNEPQDFYDLLFQPLDDNFFNAMTSYEIDGVWVARGQLCFLIKANAPDASQTYTASMPLSAYAYALSRQGKRLFTKKAETLSPQMVAQQNVMDGDSIYSNVEKHPEMKGGSDALKQYLSHVGQPAVRLSGPVRVYTSFVVGKDGKVSDVCVLQPVDPVVDRHAAQTVKGMPNFTPGQHDGKNVLVRMYMPITYQP